MQIVIAILALSFLIIVHELGHFTVAKLSGIKVHEFALFMGPKIFSVQKGETTYTLRLVPIGGYVRMEGEEQASEDSRAFNRKPIPIRMAVIAAGPIMNLIVAIILVFIVISANGYNSTIVGPLQENSAAYQSGIREGDKVLKYNGKSIFNAMDVDLFVFGSRGTPADVEVLRGGLKEKLKIIPEVLPKNRYLLGFGPAGASGEKSRTVESIVEDSAAFKAGLKKGDIITKFNDTSVKDGKEIREFLEKNNGKELKVTVLRNGIEQNLKLTPVKGKNPESYATGLSFRHLKGGIVETFKQSAAYSFSIARTVGYSLSWLITQRVSLKEMSGPVGIVTAIGDVVQYSPTFMDKLLNLMNFTALISINLGLFNLIPFPALDGSKLIILTIEGIRRKAMPPEREALISLVGLALLVMLMIFATFNDVLRMTGKG
jgi:regulator of sigma E protease